jgi:hypothetical protein
MTKRQGKSGAIDVKALLPEDEEFLRALVRTALQEVLEAEMTEALGAEKGERAAHRQGYRSGYDGRTLITRVGKLELRSRRIEAGGSRPSCSSTISVRSGRWWRCTFKGFRAARDAMGRAARTRHHRRWKQPTGCPMPQPNDPRLRGGRL